MIYRIGTQDEEAISEVLRDNCYSLPNTLPADGLIIDVGAHIGSFAIACFKRGARKIVCYEPDPENFSILLENVKECGDSVTCINKAIYRKGVSRSRMLRGTEKTANITAVAIVHEQETNDGFVECISLEEVLNQHGHCRILKLDCEGGEWPSLVETENLNFAEQIVGELHLKIKIPGYVCSLASAHRALKVKGFDVLLTPGTEPDCNWNLFAWRET